MILEAFRGAVLCFTAMPRKSFPAVVQTEVLVKCRRRCALCFCLERDGDPKEGQLAHIDRNPENNAPENAAFLCTEHHPRYDSPSRQTKGYGPDELREYQRILYAYVESLETQTYKKRSRSRPGSRASGKAGVSLDVHDRRVPIYRTTMQFVRDVLTDLRPELKLIIKFAADTDEALFLFDENIAEYLTNLFKRALRLRTLEFMRTRMQTDDREAEHFAALVKEETDLAMWFSEQHGEIRARFAPFLHLA
jgi:hypothetical protein